MCILLCEMRALIRIKGSFLVVGKKARSVHIVYGFVRTRTVDGFYYLATDSRVENEIAFNCIGMGICKSLLCFRYVYATKIFFSLLHLIYNFFLILSMCSPKEKDLRAGTSFYLFLFEITKKSSK